MHNVFERQIKRESERQIINRRILFIKNIQRSFFTLRLFELFRFGKVHLVVLIFFFRFEIDVRFKWKNQEKNWILNGMDYKWKINGKRNIIEITIGFDLRQKWRTYWFYWVNFKRSKIIDYSWRGVTIQVIHKNPVKICSFFFVPIVCRFKTILKQIQSTKL